MPWATLRERATHALAVGMGVPVEQLGVSLVAGPGSSTSLGPFKAALEVRAGEDGLVELMTIEVPDEPVANAYVTSTGSPARPSAGQLAAN